MNRTWKKLSKREREAIRRLILHTRIPGVTLAFAFDVSEATISRIKAEVM